MIANILGEYGRKIKLSNVPISNVKKICVGMIGFLKVIRNKNDDTDLFFYKRFYF